MKERIEHVWSAHRDSEGDAHWPAERPDRDKLASRLLGACVVSAIDGWLKIALDQLHREQTPLWRRDNGGPARWEEDRTTRALFQAMSPDQRDAVQALLVSTVQGAFFSALVKLDQFPGGTQEIEGAVADVVIVDADRAEIIASAADGDGNDFHDRLDGWLNEFSEYASLLIR